MRLSDGTSSIFPGIRSTFARKIRSAPTLWEVENPSSRASPCLDVRNRTLSSSFDEPLASALAGGLDYHHSPGVLPMLPNGMPGAQSFRSTIPIRTMTGLGDGASEGLGRIQSGSVSPTSTLSR
jgi:hypothetical protein